MTEPKRLQPNKHEPSDEWLEREAILRRHYEQLAWHCRRLDAWRDEIILDGAGSKTWNLVMRDLRTTRDAAKGEMDGDVMDEQRRRISG